jgi:transposase
MTPEGRGRWTWAFVMVLAWSRAVYVEFVDRADTPSFIRCTADKRLCEAASEAGVAYI